MLPVWGILYEATEPVLKLARPLIPPIRLGMGALDLSPLIVFFVLFALQQAVCR